MGNVFRCFVEKKSGYDVEAEGLFHELRHTLGLTGLTGVRVLRRYDVEGVDEAVYAAARTTILSEPQVDKLWDEKMPAPRGEHTLLAVEALPGQYDQRADSCAQCIQMMTGGERPAVRAATVYVLQGTLTPEELDKARGYLINPVESREAALDKPETLRQSYPVPEDVPVLDGFAHMSEEELRQVLDTYGLAMDLADLKFFQQYMFEEELRDPTLTELRVVDTYWSDHCRHTTFSTHLDDIQIGDLDVQAAYEQYLAARVEVYGEEKAKKRPQTLMDLATIGAKTLKKRGLLPELDESEEINACSIHVPAQVDGQEQDWLLMFKNETHNHPTEIEPFGGAATCIGGCIRDPLSGRVFVHQAMRVTGGGDPRVPLAQTTPGKLPQRKLATTAAAGYSSYGNQIGLATGHVAEVYHPGYIAKRLECGAVVGAAPAENVRRERPAPGDVVILLGGRTGRDGIGGATGSSKSHNQKSLTTMASEVQKGNAPEERKIQRLFRRGEVTRLIKRCNDFGAGGVSVAIGELADGLSIDLDAVRKKYEGLDGTELAISESQERMAVALAPEDVDRFIALASEENLEATPVATVTEEKRLKMVWNGAAIVDVSRDFLNSNGAEKHQKAHIEKASVWQSQWAGATFGEKMKSMVGDLNICSKKGLSERFDSTIGAATVLMPFGGSHQLTPQMAMAAKLPVDGETTTCSGMTWGFNPYLMSADPYKGAMLAVVDSVTKLVAAGFRYQDMYLTFQEYFERLGDRPERWGKPLAALLGALDAQMGLGIASIGGKDSMSGSFEDLDVPPTLVSFATAIGKTHRVVSTEFKKGHSSVVLLRPFYKEDGVTPNFASLLANYYIADQMMEKGIVLSASAVGYGGIAEALFKMGLGNQVGFRMIADMSVDELFEPAYGSLVLEIATGAPAGKLLGVTTHEYQFTACSETLDSAALQEIWEAKLEPVYPYRKAGPAVAAVSGRIDPPAAPKIGVAKPRVIIPVFPGTNCEYDTARAFRAAGADPQTLVIRNLTPADVTASCEALVKAIDDAQIVMLPGGFSGGDEPDGSAKFIASFFRSPAVTDAVRRLLFKRDGLMLGICNGFQALIKLGLVPYGDIRPITPDSPTLTFNTIGRHQSMLVRTRVASTGSPWLSRCELGDEFLVPISHGEGRFVAPQAVLDQLAAQGQIATQYVDLASQPTMDLRYNPNGSLLAIEGITSPDGRILGKMGHSERRGDGLYENVAGDKFQPIFEGGVDYFRI